MGSSATGVITTGGSSKASGHAFNIANIDEKVRIFDAQLKTEISKDQLSTYLKKANPNGTSFSLSNTTNK